MRSPSEPYRRSSSREASLRLVGFAPAVRHENGPAILPGGSAGVNRHLAYVPPSTAPGPRRVDPGAWSFGWGGGAGFRHPYLRALMHSALVHQCAPPKARTAAGLVAPQTQQLQLVLVRSPWYLASTGVDRNLEGKPRGRVAKAGCVVPGAKHLNETPRRQVELPVSFS